MQFTKGSEYKKEKIIVQYKCGGTLNIVTKNSRGKYVWYIVNKENTSGKKRAESIDLGSLLEKIPEYWGGIWLTVQIAKKKYQYLNRLYCVVYTYVLSANVIMVGH